MKSVSKVAALALVCLALAACKQSVEEKAPVQESAGGDAEQADAKPRILPECAKRDKNGMYIQPGGCSGEEWIEWQKKQDAMESSK